MPASIGVNLRVTGNCRQGGRKYMEDFFSVAYQQTEDERDLEYAFFGIYDGHGGAEAAAFAKEHLMETIIKHKNFWSDNDEDVLRAIRDGYIATHYAMWREQPMWPKTSSGLPSTAGTTASIAFIRRGKIYIGHVGDSGIVLGYQEPGCSEWKAIPLTKDHKPENPDEMKRIESCGGKVVSKSGVPRVVWNRPKIGHVGPVRRSTPIDEIPFLAVARSLGDLWSYNSQINQFIVSPDPDCSVLPIDTNVHRCLIFGTDGLFNMLSPARAVQIVQQAERKNECAALSDSFNRVWHNPSKELVESALERWHTTKMRADNTSVVTLMLDPPGPPRAQVLKDRKKNLPESGLKIMTRYDGNTSQEPCNTQTSCSRSVQTSNLPEISSHVDTAQPHPVLPVPEAEPQTKIPEKDKTNIESTEATDNSTPACSNNYPLKERNFEPKLRESTSFDPREPLRTLDVGKENNTERVEDNSIQINEISSSNIEENVLDDDHPAENSESNNNITAKDAKQYVLKKSEEKKAAKRKIEGDNVQLQRKSLRLSLTQKFLEGKQPAPCTLAEEKLKKLAEEAEKLKKLSEKPQQTENMQKEKNNNESEAKKKLSITQKILKSKNVCLKKKSLVRSQLTKRNLRIVLKSVMPKRKVEAPKKDNNSKTNEKTLGKVQNTEKKGKNEKVLDNTGKTVLRRSLRSDILKPEEKNKNDQEKSAGSESKPQIRKPKKEAKIVTGKVSNFKRQSIRTSTLRSREPALKVKGKLSTVRSMKPIEKAALPKQNVAKLKNNTPTSSPNKAEKQKRITRSSLNNDSVKKQPNAKEVKQVPPKDLKTAITQPSRVSSLRQKLQGKSKSLRKTVLRKSS